MTPTGQWPETKKEQALGKSLKWAPCCKNDKCCIGSSDSTQVLFLHTEFFAIQTQHDFMPLVRHRLNRWRMLYGFRQVKFSFYSFGIYKDMRYDHKIQHTAVFLWAGLSVGWHLAVAFSFPQHTVKMPMEGLLQIVMRIIEQVCLKQGTVFQKGGMAMYILL